MHPYQAAHFLYLDRRCDMGCGFCVHNGERSIGRSDDELRRDMERGRENKKNALTISGGEPTMEPRLLTLIGLARELDYTTVTLETNGARLDDEAVAKAQAAGLTHCEVAFLAEEEVAGEAPDYAALLERLRRAGIATGLRVYLTVGMAYDDELPRAVGGALELKPAWLVLDWLPLDMIKSPEMWLHPEAVDQTLSAAMRLAEEHGVTLRLDSFNGVPGCVGQGMPEWRLLADRYEQIGKRHQAEAFQRITACESCPRKDACPGLPVLMAETLKTSAIAPAPEKRTAMVQQRAKRQELADAADDISIVDSKHGVTAIVRVNYRCQMDCDFCWVDLHGGEKTFEHICRELDRAGKQGAEHAFFSGGEPTMYRQLPDVIAHARAIGVKTRAIETNAMLLERPERARALRESGLDLGFVSLHATRPDLSDEITKAPGGFERTIRGIHNLLSEGVIVDLNYVIHPPNVEETWMFPGFVAETFAGHGRLPSIRFSLAHPITDLVDPRTMLRYSAVAPQLLRALDEAERLGIVIDEISGMCGLPPCMLGGDPRFFPEDYAGPKSSEHERNFKKVQACGSCRFEARCPGVRLGYLRTFGEEEFAPVP